MLSEEFYEEKQNDSQIDGLHFWTDLNVHSYFFSAQRCRTAVSDPFRLRYNSVAASDFTES